MDNVIVHLSKCVPGSMIASSRIALYLQRFLNLPLIHVKEDFLAYKDKQIDTIFLINGASAFSNILEDIADLVMRTRRVVFIQNDYTLHPPTQVRDAFLDRDNITVERWSTIPQLPLRWETHKTWAKCPIKATHYINWNMLTYAPLQFKDEREFPEHLFYYGAWRKDRVQLFEKYFENPPYSVMISSSKKGIEKFLDLNPCIDELPTFKNLIVEIQKFATTIYLEDSPSNTMYCSPANRFYECLSAGIAMLFDVNSQKTMNISGYSVDDFTVRSMNDVFSLMGSWRQIAERQKVWRRPYLIELNQQVQQAYNA